MSTEPDLTAAEARTAFDALAKQIGLRADIVPLLGHDPEAPLVASIYPYGLGRDATCRVKSDTWSGLLTATEAAWERWRAEVRAKLVLDMALAIIRITDAQGACTDVALAAQFSRDDVEGCGPDACAKANEMAGRGPFAIVPVAVSEAA